MEFFKKVFVHPELQVLAWSNDIDIASEAIYSMVTNSILNKVI